MQKLSSLVFISVLARVALGLNYITEKPEFLSPCNIRDSNFQQCSAQNLRETFSQLREGISGLESLPTIDPYFVKKVKFAQNNLIVKMKDVVVKGLSNVVVKESSVDEKDYSWTAQIFLPKLRIDSDYKVNGNILALTLNGQGKLFFELESIDLNLDFKLKLYEKAGLTFGNVTDIKIDFKIGGLKTRLENLFNGNVELEESINALLNENWMQFEKALQPALSQLVESILKDILQKVFNFIPTKYYISDIPTPEQLNK